MTIWLANQKFILTKENTRQRRFRLRKNNEADKTSEPIQSNPIQSNPWMNPIHVQLCSIILVCCPARASTVRRRHWSTLTTCVTKYSESTSVVDSAADALLLCLVHNWSIRYKVKPAQSKSHVAGMTSEGVQLLFVGLYQGPGFCAVQQYSRDNKGIVWPQLGTWTQSWLQPYTSQLIHDASLEPRPTRLNVSGVERPHELMSLPWLVMSTVLPWTLTACSEGLAWIQCFEDRLLIGVSASL